MKWLELEMVQYWKFEQACLVNSSVFWRGTRMIFQNCIWVILAIHASGDWVQVPILAPHDSNTNTERNAVLLSNSSTNIQVYMSNATSSPHLYPDIFFLNKTSYLDDEQPVTNLSESTFESITQNITNLKILKSANIIPPPLKQTAFSKSDSYTDNSHNKLQFNFQLVNETKPELHVREPPVEVLTSVHQSLLQKMPETFQGKLKFLQQLKERLYSNMEVHIKKLWSIKERDGRTEKGMGFPSMEGALLTICFLVFAVFLVKLVQQLIQNLQNNGGNAATMVMASMPATPAAVTGRRRRSISDILLTARVLNLVEDYQVMLLYKIVLIIGNGFLFFLAFF